jgi:hypothetical protein
MIWLEELIGLTKATALAEGYRMVIGCNGKISFKPIKHKVGNIVDCLNSFKVFISGQLSWKLGKN